jgi:hypothetical protein
MCLDVANNSRSSETRKFTLDTTKPNIILSGPSAGELIIGNLSVFNFSVFDNIASNLTCNLTVNGVNEISNFDAIEEAKQDVLAYLSSMMR